MKNKVLVGVAILILLGVGYWYTQKNSAQSEQSSATFSCDNFVFTLPVTWYAWSDDGVSDTSYKCTAATFPQDQFEERVAGIAHFTKDERDAFVSFYVVRAESATLDEYIDGIYCPIGNNCGIETVYIETKTAIPFGSGEAYRVIDTGGEYPAATTYYYKKGDTIMTVMFDMKNTLRKEEIVAIAESVE